MALSKTTFPIEKQPLPSALQALQKAGEVFSTQLAALMVSERTQWYTEKKNCEMKFKALNLQMQTELLVFNNRRRRKPLSVCWPSVEIVDNFIYLSTNSNFNFKMQREIALAIIEADSDRIVNSKKEKISLYEKIPNSIFETSYIVPKSGRWQYPTSQH